jgi:hypothetical protein
VTADEIHQRLLDALSRGSDVIPFTVSECYELCEVLAGFEEELDKAHTAQCDLEEELEALRDEHAECDP